MEVEELPKTNSTRPGKKVLQMAVLASLKLRKLTAMVEGMTTDEYGTSSMILLGHTAT